MPNTPRNDHPTPAHHQEAQELLRDLVVQYQNLNEHARAGRVPWEQARAQQAYDFQFGYLAALVAEGLHTGRVLF